MVKPLKSRVKRKALGSSLSLQVIGGMRNLFLTLLPMLFSLALAAALFGSVVAYAFGSPAFRLEDVRVHNIGTLTPDQAFQFCELKKGENLITLDIIGVQQVIKRKHPEFKEVRVRRVLPNRIEVVLKRRTPIAQVAFSRYVQIDRDLVILPGSSPVPFRNLTIIEGAPLPREGLTVGVSIRDAATKRAIKLADLIERSNILRRHALTKVSIADAKNMAFFVDGDLEVKIGDSHLVERLKILDQTLRSVELDRTKIQYIDLRFDDVVIGPR